jgi:hypothetical protein
MHYSPTFATHFVHFEYGMDVIVLLGALGCVGVAVWLICRGRSK